MHSPCYSGTTNEILLSDIVNVDGERGEIKLICLPGSDDASAYNCKATGGLLIKPDQAGFMLVSFDEIDKVELVERPPKQRLGL